MNRNIFFLLFFFFLLYLFYLIFKPFIVPLVWAGVVSIIIYRPYRYCTRRFKRRESPVALLFTIAIFLIIVIPVISIFFLLTQEVVDAYSRYKDVLLDINFSSYFSKFFETPFGASLQKFINPSESQSELITKIASGITTFLLSHAQNIAKNTGVLIFRLIIMLIGIFFFLRDGEKITNFVKKLLPLETEMKDVVVKKLDETVNAVLIGMLVTAMVQGFLLSIGFLIFGVGYPVLFGVLTFILALLPFGGAVPVWLGGAIYLFITGRIGAGIGLIIWGALLVSSIDNFLKPILIGEKTRIPFFLLFLSMLGGIMSFGLTGLFIGPVLVAVLLALFKVYVEEYQKV